MCEFFSIVLWILKQIQIYATIITTSIYITPQNSASHPPPIPDPWQLLICPPSPYFVLWTVSYKWNQGVCYLLISSFHSAQGLWESSKLLHMSVVHSFLIFMGSVELSPLSFLLSLSFLSIVTTGLSILLTILKNHLLVSLICCIISLFSM